MTVAHPTKLDMTQPYQPSLFGRLLRSATRWIVSRYYRDIEITGGERIPQTGPVLLCGNHPNSLLDPVIVGIAARRSVRFLAKAPLFKTPVLGRLMYAIGMIPAFRGQDDAKQVKKNVESLDAGANALAAGEAMGIFPEGKSHDAMQVEMVRSGAVRMTVAALNAGAKELTIVPIGLNYQRQDRFRSNVWVDVGEPIEAARWFGDGDLDDRKAMREFTGELERRLKAVAVHLDHPEFEPLVYDLELMFRRGDSETVKLRKRIADGINRFHRDDPEAAEALGARIEKHRRQADAEGIPLDAAILQDNDPAAVLRIIGGMLSLLALLPVALVGALFHLPPFVVTRLIARFVTPPGRTAVSFYLMLIGLPVYMLWYAAAGYVALRGDVSLIWTIVGLSLMPPAGVVALAYWPRAPVAIYGFWRQLLLMTRREPCRQLRAEHQSLRSELLAIAENR